MSLKGVAKSTLNIIANGGFQSDNGEWVSLQKKQELAVRGTKLYRPEDFSELVVNSSSRRSKPKIQVINNSTQKLAYQLVVNEEINDLVLLNSASARNAGGGFINGAKAQEEDLCRCSGLYPCLINQPSYYEVNRKHDSLLYTDHIIYSPNVPWFRVNNRELLNVMFTASVITAPAPNAGQVLRKQQGDKSDISRCLYQRCGKVLEVARDNGHRNILLGAWGCGVFCNDAEAVADIFAIWLESASFSSAFDRVVFGVWDRSQSQSTFTAFNNRFC